MTASGYGSLSAVEWQNVISHGADPTGSADSTSGMQGVLSSLPPGGFAYVPPVYWTGSAWAQAVYKVTSPLTVPPGVAFGASYAATGYPTGDYGVAGLPLTGAVLLPSSSFSGTEVVLFTDGGVQSGQQKLSNLIISGTSLPGGNTVMGINSVGAVGGVMLDKVLVYGTGSHGLQAVRGAGAANPDDWKVRDCEFIASSGGCGVITSGLADSWWWGVKCAGNSGDNWNITNGAGSRYFGVKAENSGTGYGYNITGFTGFTGTVQFIGATSAGNAVAGVGVSGSGTGTFRFSALDASDTVPWAWTGTNRVLTTGWTPGFSASPGSYMPGDSSWIAWNADPALMSSATGATVTSGTIYLVRVDLRTWARVTNVVLFLGTNPTGTLTSGENFAGLYNSAGTLIAATADQTGNWSSGASVFRQMALSGGPYDLSPGMYWVAVLANGTSALPVFGKLQIVTTAGANAAQAAATSRWATNGTGTSLPGSITPSSNSQTNLELWAGLS